MTLSYSRALVQTLRASFAITDRRHFCQCGKFCPQANACIPVAGEVHSPYYTIAERIDRHGQPRWAVFLYDPQKAQAYPLNNHWYSAPCEAARAGLRISMTHSPRRPLRLDLVRTHGETSIDWSVLEETLASELYNQGYNLWLATSFAPEGPPPHPTDFAHPLIAAGYHAARAEAVAVLVEDGGDPDDDEQPSWELLFQAEMR